MSYLNPILRYGLEQLAANATNAGIAGVVIPDLPFDEAHAIAEPLRAARLAIVHMATPLTSPQRLQQLLQASSGFLYAVTTTGTTGNAALDPAAITTYLHSLRAAAATHAARTASTPLPICAGFGIRSAHQVNALRAHADGVIVGSALIEAIRDHQDPAAFLNQLRSA